MTKSWILNGKSLQWPNILDHIWLVKGTVPRLSLVYFLNVLPNTPMRLNVCREITSMDLNDKTIASLQPKV